MQLIYVDPLVARVLVTIAEDLHERTKEHLHEHGAGKGGWERCKRYKVG